MSLEELSSRIKSNIPGPVSKAGYAIRPESFKTVVYNGQLLPTFLFKHKAPPQSFPEFLLRNHIGNVFEELESGMGVVIPSNNSFAKHPNA